MPRIGNKYRFYFGPSKASVAVSPATARRIELRQNRAFLADVSLLGSVEGQKKEAKLVAQLRAEGRLPIASAREEWAQAMKDLSIWLAELAQHRRKLRLPWPHLRPAREKQTLPRMGEMPRAGRRPRESRFLPHSMNALPKASPLTGNGRLPGCLKSPPILRFKHGRIGERSGEKFGGRLPANGRV